MTPEKLQKYTKRPGDIYEIYLGSDSLEVLFAIGEQRNLHRLKEDKFFIQEKQLTKAKLLENWGVEKFDIYVGAEGSGTRNRWESYLFDGNNPTWWSRTKIWDIRINRILNDWQSESKPRIYLGSTVLNKGDSETLDGYKLGEKILIPHVRLPIFEEVKGEPKKVKRGLYLYGWINKRLVHGKGEGDGYNLEPSVVDVLKYVFNSLKGIDNETLHDDCLRGQIEFFHLTPEEKEGEGWIVDNKSSNADLIHRQEPCKGRIE